MTAGASVTAILDDDGKVTYSLGPSQNSRAEHYVDAAYAAGAVLYDARKAYLQFNDYEWPHGARETTYGRFTNLWRKAEAAGMGEADAEERQRAHFADREAVNEIVAGIERKHPGKARRAQLVSSLNRKGYDRREAIALALEAIPDPAGGDEGDDPQAPLVTSGADLVEGVTLDDTPMLAPGLAYVGRAVLVHALRGRGKDDAPGVAGVACDCRGPARPDRRG